MRSPVGLICSCALSIGMALAGPGDGRCQTAGFDRSPRAYGMGHAAAAVFWGGDPEPIANPALLAYHRGLRYLRDEREILPGLADLEFSDDRLTLSHAGVGLEYLTGRLHERSSDQDLFRISSFGVAISAASLVEALSMRAGGGPPRWTRHGDIALGYVRNTERLSRLAYSDVGALVRITPVDRWTDYESRGWPFRVDLGYGWSASNVGRARYPGEDFRTERVLRNGVSARVALGWPGSARGFPHWLARLTDPLLSVGGAWDWVDVEHADWRYRGAELGVANMLFLRRGHVDDPSGGIKGPTAGWGIGLMAEGLGGFRYDRARIPQATTLPEVESWGFTVFVDPLGIVRTMR